MDLISANSKLYRAAQLMSISSEVSHKTSMALRATSGLLSLPPIYVYTLDTMYGMLNISNEIAGGY